MTPEKRFCLIGHPVQGSLSPALMEAAYHGRYAYDLIDEDRFETAFERAKEYDAFNVTAPYKVDAYKAALSHDRNSMGAEACNLMVPTSKGGESGYLSYNTDVDGVANALKEGGYQHVGPFNDTALVVGAGGAAAAACIALVGKLQHPVTVAGRNLEKARQLAERTALQSGEPVQGVHYTGLSPIELDPKMIRGVDVIVYTLPGSAPVPEGLPLGNAIVLEAEYKHPRLADAPCRQYVSGKLWLLHQAVSGFYQMTHEDPDVNAMREVLGLPRR